MRRLYLHLESDEELKKLLESKIKIGEFMSKYQQPDWCSYPNALEGVMGCWSLMDLFGKRKQIGHKFCSGCECYKGD